MQDSTLYFCLKKPFSATAAEPRVSLGTLDLGQDINGLPANGMIGLNGQIVVSAVLSDTIFSHPSAMANVYARCAVRQQWINKAVPATIFPTNIVGGPHLYLGDFSGPYLDALGFTISPANFQWYNGIIYDSYDDEDKPLSEYRGGPHEIIIEANGLSAGQTISGTATAFINVGGMLMSPPSYHAPKAGYSVRLH